MSRYAVIDGAARKVTKRYTVIDGVARKVNKRYVVVDGVTRLVYSSGPAFAYSGAYAESDVTVDGVNYTMWTITGSGTLEISDPVQYWMCGGGGKGGVGSRPTGEFGNYTAAGGSGGGGGGGRISTGTLEAGSHVVTVGAGNSGASKIGSITAKGGSAGSNGSAGSKGGNGNAGGGAGITYSGSYLTWSQILNAVGTGEGVSSYPFGLTDLYAHCAGGGGGAEKFQYYSGKSKFGRGGRGGTDGGNGRNASSGKSNGLPGGSGGAKGGGKGGNVFDSVSTTPADTAGSAASFYGSGGGGGVRRSEEGSSSSTYTVGGNGYQGVIYLLIPKIPAA